MVPANSVRTTWDALLQAAREVHQHTAALSAFCAFPDDVQPIDVVPNDIPAAHLMAAEKGLFTDQFAGLRDAFIAAGPLATWRETYKGTDIGADFMDRFACYCLIGKGGAFTSRKICAWVVYMPPVLT